MDMTTASTVAKRIRKSACIANLTCPRCDGSLTARPAGRVVPKIPVYEYTCDRCHASVAMFF
jgi:predicted nucleic acid-binding Zn ribbon protein